MKYSKKQIRKARVSALILSAISLGIFGTLACVYYENTESFYFFLALGLAALGPTVSNAWILIKNQNKEEKDRYD